MRLPSKNLVFAFLLGIVTLVVIYFGYNLGLKFTALEKAWRYPEAVREMQVSEVVIATYSGEIKK